MRSSSLFFAILLAGIVSLAAVRPAAAQTLVEPRERQGYYVALGLYDDPAIHWEKGRSLGVWNGTAFTIRLGQMLTRRFGLGFVIDSAGSTGKGQTSSMGGLGIEGQANLWRNLGLHAGLGLGFVSVKDPALPTDDQVRGGYGAKYALGASYDFFFTDRLSGGWSLAPTVTLHALPTTGIDGGWLFVGAQLSWWSGLRRNELQLPESEAYKK